MSDRDPSLAELLFRSIGMENKSDLHCLIRALEEREAEMEHVEDFGEARRCRRMLTQARKRLDELE